MQTKKDYLSIGKKETNKAYKKATCNKHYTTKTTSDTAMLIHLDNSTNNDSKYTKF